MASPSFHHQAVIREKNENFSPLLPEQHIKHGLSPEEINLERREEISSQPPPTPPPTSTRNQLGRQFLPGPTRRNEVRLGRKSVVWVYRGFALPKGRDPVSDKVPLSSFHSEIKRCELDFIFLTSFQALLGECGPGM